MPHVESKEHLVNSVIEPYATEQQTRTHAIQLRQSRQAKFFFACSVALLSSYVTVQVQHYFSGKQINSISILVALVLVVAVRSRWRAT